jgi:hypothetical protein
MSLLGDLGEVQIGDVLRVFAASRKTGVLTVAGPGRQAVLHLQKGALVHASNGRLTGDDAVLDVFGWKQGSLTFSTEDRVALPNVTRTLDVLVTEGLRVGDTLHRMQELIPSDRVSFQMSLGPADPEARYSVGSAEWRVLRHLDGIRDLREVTEASRLPRAEVTKVLFEMTQAGFLERVEPQKSLRVQAQGMFGKDAAEVDEGYDAEWRKISRCSAGVQRIEVRSLGGRIAQVPVTFRAGLIRDIHLPRAVLTALSLREGEELFVRPAPW